jgi:hypothetical protein
MDFTFGIITSGGAEGRIQQIVASIRAQNIPRYEIVVVGGAAIEGADIHHIPFDESRRAGWISRKKNMILKEARYEYICMVHDYVALEPGWYEEFLKEGANWSFGTNRILNENGERYRDKLIFRWGIGHLFPRGTWLPEDAEVQPHQMKLLYISGAHFVIRRDIAQKHLLDERLAHQQGEDVEYSQRLSLHGVPIQFNRYSSVRFLKHKDLVQFDHAMTAEELTRFLELTPEECDSLFRLQRKYLCGWYASEHGISLDY